MNEVIVEGDKVQTPSQKFVLTGGDVSVVTRQEIEQRHFSDVKEALLTIPGVSIEDPGYHAQAYEESSYASQTIRVNGDNRVLILVNGKRMDVGVSSGSGNSRSKTNLALLTGIGNIERIEVVKGQGALAYGSDATSIINIITRQGTVQPHGKVSVAAGSWGKREYKLAQTGQAGEWKYMVNASWSKGDDTKYKDWYLGKTVTYKNSKYDDRNAGISVSRDIDDERSIEFNFSHMSNKDHFPISALDYKKPYIKGYSNLASWYPGYRNMFKGDQDDGVYTQTLSNDFDATYTFMKDHDVPSYVRAYRNYHRYYEMDGVGWTPLDVEQNVGADVQYGRLYRGKDVFLAGLNAKHGKYHYNGGADYAGQDPAEFTNEWIKRDDFSLYAQDKIKASDKWTVTPGIRYSHYGKTDYKERSWDDDSSSAVYTKEKLRSFSRFTGGLFANYSPNEKIDVYGSWSQLFNVPYASDIRRNADVKPEKGNLYTVGVKYKVSPKTNASIGYTYSDIQDAIVRYSYLNPDYNPDTMRPRSRWISKVINLDQTKSGLTLAVDHQFSSLWSANLSFTHSTTHQSGAINQNNPNEDENYKRMYPDDMWKLDVNYHSSRWSADILGIYYDGCNTKWFSDDHFLVMDASINYKVHKGGNIFFKMNNIFNETYETRASAWGIGAFPQPSRNFMMGYEYSF